MEKKQNGKFGLDVSRNLDVKSAFIVDAFGKKVIPDDIATRKLDTLLTAAVTSKQNGNALSLADAILKAYPKKQWEKTVINLDVREVVLDGNGKDCVWYRDFTATMTLKALDEKVTAYRLIQSTIESFKTGTVINHRSTKDGNGKASTTKTKTTTTKPENSWLPKASKPKASKPETATIEVIQ
jgi:hypothetical protein